MMRGCSLEKDLRISLNNPKYSDIEILCGDEEKFHCCKAILAVRSDVFDKLLYNGMKESYQNQISFPTINSSGMKIILEYIYTGSIIEESLTKDNIIEAYYAADYFQLTNLQEFITILVKKILKKNYALNYSPELLSNVSEKLPLTEDNIINLLVEAVAVMPLNNIEFGRLSIAALKYLLSCTHEKDKPFVTPEYEVFRYSAILTAKKVSNNAHKALVESLPTLEQMENLIRVENKPIPDHQKVANELEPLIKFIDFRRIKDQILIDVIEPLDIIPAEIIQHNTGLINLDLSDVRGVPFHGHDYVWDESACGSKLVVDDNGELVYALSGLDNHQSIRAKMVLENKGTFEWDVIIEKSCAYAWVGVCASEYNAAGETISWSLGSNGNYYSNCGNSLSNYCSPFGDNTKITVHIDMDKRACAFTVNGVRYREIVWNNLPSKLYPVVSLKYPGRLRIQAHQKQ